MRPFVRKLRQSQTLRRHLRIGMMIIVGLLFCSAGKGTSREIGSEPIWIRTLTLPRRAPVRADI